MAAPKELFLPVHQNRLFLAHIHCHLVFSLLALLICCPLTRGLGEHLHLCVLWHITQGTHNLLLMKYEWRGGINGLCLSLRGAGTEAPGFFLQVLKAGQMQLGLNLLFLWLPLEKNAWLHTYPVIQGWSQGDYMVCWSRIEFSVCLKTCSFGLLNGSISTEF